jgi:hypothetical protein
MSPEEAKRFFERAFVAFPGLREWISGLKSDKENLVGRETMEVWARTLKGVEFNEATDVLESWIDCSLPEPPVGYRRETFAIDVRSIVMRRRSDAKAETYSERAREELWLKSNRGKYQPSNAFVSIAKPFMRMLDLRKQVMACELSVEEYDRLCDEIVHETFPSIVR